MNNTAATMELEMLDRYPPVYSQSDQSHIPNGLTSLQIEKVKSPVHTSDEGMLNRKLTEELSKGSMSSAASDLRALRTKSQIISHLGSVYKIEETSVDRVKKWFSGDHDQVDPEWNSARRCLAEIFSGPLFNTFIGLAVGFQVIVIILETNTSASGDEIPTWCVVANTSLTVLYVTELTVRLWVFRTHFFRSVISILDMVVILGDLAMTYLNPDSVDGMMRVLRVFRLTRSIKTLKLFPELHVMMIGMAGAARVMLWGMLLIVATLTLWSIMAVQLLHPVNKRVAANGTYSDCARCPHAFESVWMSVLTFSQQIIAGDSWGTVSLPIIEEEPYTIWIFGAVFLTVGMGIMNLILAGIVDSSLEARKETEERIASRKEHDFRVCAQAFLKICAELDTDHSGTLSLQEILTGFQESVGFRSTMKSMDIEEKELRDLFAFMDTEKTGQISYEAFVEVHNKLKCQDARNIQFFMRHRLEEIFQAHEMDRRVLDEHRRQTRSEIAALRSDIAGLAALLRPLQNLPDLWTQIQLGSEGSSGVMSAEQATERSAERGADTRCVEKALAPNALCRQCECVLPVRCALA